MIATTADVWSSRNVQNEGMKLQLERAKLGFVRVELDLCLDLYVELISFEWDFLGPLICWLQMCQTTEHRRLRGLCSVGKCVADKRTCQYMSNLLEELQIYFLYLSVGIINVSLFYNI